MTTADSLPPDPNPADSIVRSVRGLLEDVLLIDVPDLHTDLFSEGLLDSVGLVELLVQLEERFAVEVPAADLDVDDFRSVNAIAAFVCRQDGGRQDGGRQDGGRQDGGRQGGADDRPLSEVTTPRPLDARGGDAPVRSGGMGRT